MAVAGPRVFLQRRNPRYRHRCALDALPLDRDLLHQRKQAGPDGELRIVGHENWSSISRPRRSFARPQGYAHAPLVTEGYLAAANSVKKVYAIFLWRRLGVQLKADECIQSRTVANS